MKQISKIFVLALTILSTLAPTAAEANWGMPAPMPSPMPIQQPRPTSVTRIEQRVTIVQRTHIVNRGGGCYNGYCQQNYRGMGYPGYYPYYPMRRHCKRRWGRCRGRGVRVAVNTPWVSVGVNVF